MRIIASDSAFPENYYPQQEITNALSAYWAPSLERTSLIRRFHRNAGVDGRYLAMPLTKFVQLRDWGEANNAWISIAEDLGERVITGALAQAGVDARHVGALFFVSITGIANPSVDARLMNRIDFSPHLRRVPIFGLGCVAGAAGIARAADYVRAYPDQIAVLLSVELCSLTWQRQDLTTANIISTGLFGDGAAAIVIAGREVPLAGPQVIASESVFYQGTEELMGWNITHDGMRVVLSPEVPQVVLRNFGANTDSFLAKFGLTRDDIGLWIMHTGGPRVLEAMAESLAVPRDALENSWRWLRKVGNLSSASVLVVLDDIMKNSRPPEGTWSVLAAMGPGFCSELVLIRW